MGLQQLVTLYVVRAEVQSTRRHQQSQKTNKQIDGFSKAMQMIVDVVIVAYIMQGYKEIHTVSQYEEYERASTDRAATKNAKRNLRQHPYTGKSCTTGQIRRGKGESSNL